MFRVVLAVEGNDGTVGQWSGYGMTDDRHWMGEDDWEVLSLPSSRDQVLRGASQTVIYLGREGAYAHAQAQVQAAPPGRLDRGSLWLLEDYQHSKKHANKTVS